MFQNKTIVITGAGSGIGRALAIEAAQRGAQVIATDWNEAALQETVAAASGRIYAERLDVSQQEAVHAFAEKMMQQFTSIDIVVNNAGVSLAKYTLDEVSYDDFRWLMDVNFWGVVYGSKAFLPHLKTRPEAWLVNISSVFGLAGIAAQSPYCASKFAVRGFTESLRMELIGSSVIPLVVHPGGIDTNIVRNGRHRSEEDRQALSEHFQKNAAKTTPEKAAAQILRAIEKKQRKLLIGPDAHFMDTVIRWLPVQYSNLFYRVMKKLSL
jgi:NAD(P)-dependent dehydrogenase (short-subunit alcohol dehydrogenase family)